MPPKEENSGEIQKSEIDRDLNQNQEDEKSQRFVLGAENPYPLHDLEELQDQARNSLTTTIPFATRKDEYQYPKLKEILKNPQVTFCHLESPSQDLDRCDN